MIKKILSFTPLISLILCFSVYAQEPLVWINPLDSGRENIVHGKAEASPDYFRLPETIREEVRQPVWRLSRHAAGLKLKFTTGAKNINVRYSVSGSHAMPHMPATGVSGVDLYAKTASEQWVWVKGNYSFADTILYDFIINDEFQEVRQYELYLPLYNEVSYLELGVPLGASIEILPKESSKQAIVVYGTSIAQGACASRPGMAWTAIVERNVNLPVINLGFSGNGQLERPLIAYMAEIESSLYILDCLPNLVRDTFDQGEVKNRIRDAVKLLKSRRPHTPILLVDHAGYTDELINTERKEAYQKRNSWSRQTYQELLDAGIQGLFYLKKDAIGLGMDATVDGTHPSDLGMDQYARAYTAKIREILP
ncbi:SGNH/GDSL hydrolase family protein [Cyclobacterium lianum]|nr:SGNH/GDSL hydrolase family protein [Cyclobacterium lianum]